MAELTQAQRQALIAAQARKRQAAQRADPEKTGRILPVSRTESGELQFDPNAGILGAIIGGVSLPTDVMSGETPRTVPLFPDSTDELGAALVRNPEYYDRAAEAAAVGSPASPASRVVGAPTVKAVRQKVDIPSAEDLYKVGSRQFQEGRAMDVRFNPEYVNSLGRNMQTRLTQEGFDGQNAPKTFSVLRDMQQQAERGAFASYDDILKIRNRLKKARMDFQNPTDKAAAEQVIRGVEKFVSDAPGMARAASGPVAALARTHRDALGNYAAGRRSRDLGALESSAIRRAAAANSGQNIGNTIRSRAASLLDNPKKLKGLKPDEIAALEKVAVGTPDRNALRTVGNLLGGGGGLGQAVTAGGPLAIGAAAGNPMLGAAIGAGVYAGGKAAKMADNMLTRRAMRKVDQAVRKRSPLYKSLVNSAPYKAASPEQKAAMVRMLFATQEGSVGPE